MKQVVIMVLGMMATSPALATNTMFECNVANGPAGALRVELGNDGSPFYTVNIENDATEGGLIELGRFENVVADASNFSGVKYGENGEIVGYLYISNRSGSYYANYPTPVSAEPGLNKELILESCINPNFNMSRRGASGFSAIRM